MDPLYKSTITVWSNVNLENQTLKELIANIENGSSLCTNWEVEEINEYSSLLLHPSFEGVQLFFMINDEKIPEEIGDIALDDTPEPYNPYIFDDDYEFYSE